MKRAAKSLKARQSELDVIRIFAFFTLIGTHFFLNTGFYHERPGGDPAYWTALALMTLNAVTMPLFMLLTGWLLCEKPRSTKWFLGLSRVLVIYVLCCFVTVPVREYLETGYRPSLSGIFWSLLNFSINPYSWYIEMYIGLYLLSPFLNILHQQMDQKWEKIWLAVLFVMIILPTFTNYFRVFSLTFWRHPESALTVDKILPDYWTSVPCGLFYYAAGAYLRKYPLKIRMRRMIALFIICLAAFTLYNYWRMDGEPFSVRPWSGFEGFEAAVLSVLLFSIMQQGLQGKIKGERVRGFLRSVADWTLGAYLLSYCTDRVIYPSLTEKLPAFRAWFPWFPAAVAGNGILCLLLAAAVTGLAAFILRFEIRISLRKKSNTDQDREGGAS